VIVLISARAEPADVRALDPSSVIVLAPSMEAVASLRLWTIAQMEAPESLQSGSHAVRAIELEGVTVDLSAHVVRWNGEEICLSASEFEILAALADRIGAAITFEDLSQAAWASGQRGDHARMRSAVRRLRVKLRAAGAPVRIESVRCFGYRLERVPIADGG
jgi:DNA-binding response OmpR family regulator